MLEIMIVITINERKNSMKVIACMHACMQLYSILHWAKLGYVYNLQTPHYGQS